MICSFHQAGLSVEERFVGDSTVVGFDFRTLSVQVSLEVSAAWWNLCSVIALRLSTPWCLGSLVTVFVSLLVVL